MTLNHPKSIAATRNNLLKIVFGGWWWHRELCSAFAQVPSDRRRQQAIEFPILSPFGQNIMRKSFSWLGARLCDGFRKTTNSNTELWVQQSTYI